MAMFTAWLFISWHYARVHYNFFFKNGMSDFSDEIHWFQIPFSYKRMIKLHFEKLSNVF